MGNKSFKKEQFQNRIMGELNQILRTEVSDPRVQFVSITKVELSNDNSFANVAWDTFDASKRGDASKAIQGLTSKLRSLLSQKIKVRHTPELRFHYDGQFEGEKSIEAILDSEAKAGKSF